MGATAILWFAPDLIQHAFPGPAARDGNSAFSNLADAFAYVAMSAFILWRLPSLSQSTWREIGIRRPSPGQLGWGLLALFLSRIILRLIFAAYLSAAGQEHHTQTGFENFQVRTPLEHVTSFAQIAVACPIGEELLFRATLLAAIASRFGITAGVIVSGLIFGALHFDGIFFPMLAADGIILGALYAKTRNLIVPMLVHGASNAMALV